LSHFIDPTDDMNGAHIPAIYQVTAVINHHGEDEAGHFTAVTKDLVSGLWTKYNDDNEPTTVPTYGRVIKETACFFVLERKAKNGASSKGERVGTPSRVSCYDVGVSGEMEADDDAMEIDRPSTPPARRSPSLPSSSGGVFDLGAIANSLPKEDPISEQIGLLAGSTRKERESSSPAKKNRSKRSRKNQVDYDENKDEEKEEELRQQFETNKRIELAKDPQWREVGHERIGRIRLFTEARQSHVHWLHIFN